MMGSSLARRTSAPACRRPPRPLNGRKSPRRASARRGGGEVSRVGRSGFLDAEPPHAFAHRGFAPDGGENSMSAFERAVALGYRYLETDVRVTADGVALAFHDARLDRGTDRSGRIPDLPWSEVARARIAGREQIPLVADLLAAWPD